MTTDTLTPSQVRQSLLEGREIALLDVREEAPFAEGHPLWAANLPTGRIELDAWRRIPRRDTVIAVYDNGEGLAEPAARALQALGYTRVHLLAGGLQSWKDAGLELFIDVNVPSKSFGEWLEAERHTPSLPAEEVQALIDGGADMVVLDARRWDEYQTMSIPTGVSVPGAELVLRAQALAPSPSTHIVVNCAGRTRSIVGTQSLVNAGLPHRITALRNGTIGWLLAGQRLDHGASRRAPEVTPAQRAQAAGRARAVADRAGVRRASAADLQRFAAEGKRTTYRFDVRTPEEYAAGHLPGFRHYAGGQLVQETDHAAPVRGARIVLADDDGVRANMSASWLAQMGWEAWVLDDAPGFTETGEPAPDHPALPAPVAGVSPPCWRNGCRAMRKAPPCWTSPPAPATCSATSPARGGCCARSCPRRWRPCRAHGATWSPAAPACSRATPPRPWPRPRGRGVRARRRHAGLDCRGPAAGARRDAPGQPAHRPLPPPLRRHGRATQRHAGVPRLGVRAGGAVAARRHARLPRDLTARHPLCFR